MRIGIDARPLSYQLTGIGYYLKYLLNEIQKADNTNQYFLISNAPIKFDLFNDKWTKIEGNFKKRLLSTFWIQTRALQLVSKLNIDIFWGTRHHLPLFLPDHVKSIVTIHDIVHRLYPDTMAFPNLAVERLLMPRSIKRAVKIITDSQSTFDDIVKYYKVDSEKIVKIQPGMPGFPKTQTGIANENGRFPSKYFLFVGTLDPRKNFERIFRAFELTNPQEKDIHLVIVGGKGWKNTSFHRMIADHRLSPFIHLTQYISRSRLLQYYERSICLLFPSIYEGFGFPVLEAMSCGTPVITSNTSSMPEVAGSAAIYVSPFNVNEIADAMCRIIVNENLRMEMKAKGLEWVKRFSWKQCASETIEVFNSV